MQVRTPVTQQINCTKLKHKNMTNSKATLPYPSKGTKLDSNTICI